MAQPQPPVYPAYPPFPPYPVQMPYVQGNPYQGNGIDPNTLMNFIQETSINKNVTDTAKSITHDIGQTDRNLTHDMYSVNANIASGVGAVKDSIFAGNTAVRDLVSSSAISTRDSVERGGIATNATLTVMEQASADRERDIIQAIERTSGEARYTGAVLSATDRQANNDLARDIVAQTNRGANEILSSVAAGGVSTNLGVSALNVANSERSRDILQAIERNAGETRYSNATDRMALTELAASGVSESNRGINEILAAVAAGGVSTNVGVAALNVANSERSRDIMQTIERNAGEARYTTAVTSAGDRQMMSDLYRDGVQQSNRGMNEILTQIAATGVAGALATNSSGYETRTLINQSNAGILSSSAAQYASLLLEGQKSLLEQYKMKETLATQMSDAKYEALKNKESLAAQMAECCCETKMEVLKNAERLSTQILVSSNEAKYEALKNTQLMSSQLAECCCEIKEKVGHVSNKLDDTVRILDGNRVRDALSVANNEINLLKVMDYSRRRDRSPDRRRDRSPERR